MADDERRAEIGAEELATALKQHFAPQDVGYGRMPVTAHAIDLARWFLDRVRDARGDDEVRGQMWGDPPATRSSQGEDHEPETMFDVEPQSWEDTAKSLMREKVERVAQDEDHEAGIEICARAPQDDDAEKMDALGSYLEKYPPAGFADRYSADGWRHIARGVLSAATMFFAARSPQGEGHEAARLNAATEWLAHGPMMTEGYKACRDAAIDLLAALPSPSRDGTVAVEDLERWAYNYVLNNATTETQRMYEALKHQLGSPASTGDREGPNPGTGHGQ